MYVIRGDNTENVCCHSDDLLTPRTVEGKGLGPRLVYCPMSSGTLNVNKDVYKPARRLGLASYACSVQFKETWTESDILW